jgi:hypothetical protein
MLANLMKVIDLHEADVVANDTGNHDLPTIFDHGIIVVHRSR